MEEAAEAGSFFLTMLCGEVQGAAAETTGQGWGEVSPAWMVQRGM